MPLDDDLEGYVRAARRSVDRAWLAASLLQRRDADAPAPEPRRFPTFAVQLPPGQGGLTPEEVQAALALVEDAATEARAGGLHAGEVDAGVRRSAVRWLPATPEPSWLHTRVLALAHAANEGAGWHFDLDDEPVRLQVATYTDADQGTYDWHVDLGVGPLSNRKVSVVIELEAAKEGGVLELGSSGRAEAATVPPGGAVVFPSYLLHRLTPVTKGRRRSLAAWVCGPPFR